MTEKTVWKAKNQRIDIGLYQKENPTFFKGCYWECSKIRNWANWILVEDGPLTPSSIGIGPVKAESDIPVKRYPLGASGLGLALRRCLQCQYIIARMDTDDIVVPDRFEKQVQLMEKEKPRPIRWTYCRVYWQSWWDCFLPSCSNQHADIVLIKDKKCALTTWLSCSKKDMVLKTASYEDGLYEDDLLAQYDCCRSWIRLEIRIVKSGSCPEQGCLSVVEDCVTKLYRQLVNECRREGKFLQNTPRVLPFRWLLPFVQDLSDSLFLWNCYENASKRL